MRRVEDRIRKLCSQLLNSNDDSEMKPIVVELREVLHQHINHLRVHLSDYPRVVERRSRNAPPPDVVVPSVESRAANSK
jgi:hypothetical protein